MPRPPRLEQAGAFHHVMNRGARRQAIFLDDKDRSAFLALLHDARERFGMETHAYCLMGNHFHLLVRTPEPNLGQAMQRVSGLHARWFNDSHGCDGPLFRGRFASKPVDSDAYLLHLSRYIHRNPVDAGLVDRPGDYRWSSYSNYAGSGGPHFVRCDFLLALVGGPSPRRHYLRYVGDESTAVHRAVA